MLTAKHILAGNCTFTIEPSKESIQALKCKPHYTFKVTKSKDGKVYFLAYMVGSDNTSDYQYVGILNPITGKVRFTAKSNFKEEDLHIRILFRTLDRIWANEQRKIEDAGWNLHHSGRCCRCGKLLTVPASVETGIGPECEIFYALGITSYDEVPVRTDRCIAKLQYAYWMSGLRGTLDVIKDAAKDAGWEDNKADALAEATRKVMRKFKKGSNLPREWVALVVAA